MRKNLQFITKKRKEKIFPKDVNTLYNIGMFNYFEDTWWFLFCFPGKHKNWHVIKENIKELFSFGILGTLLDI